MPRPSTAPPPSPGRRGRWNYTTWASPARRPCCSSACRTHSLQRCHAAAVIRSAAAAQRRASRTLGPRNFRRSADSTGAHRRYGRSRHRATITARIRVLAIEAAQRRSRDPERALSSYVQELQTALETLSRAGLSRPRIHGEACAEAYSFCAPISSRVKRDWHCWLRRAPCCSVATAVSRSRSTAWSRTLRRVPPPAPDARSARDSTSYRA